MFSKLKDKVNEKMSDPNSALSQMLAKLEVEKMGPKAIEITRSVCKQTDEQSKQEVRTWLASVKKIRSDSALSTEQKESQIEALDTSETIIKFLKAVLDALINEVPVENKDALKMGVKGAGMATSMFSMGMDTVALMVFKKAVPKLVIHEKFDGFAKIIETELA